MMNIDTLKVIVQKTFACANGSCTFAFQGGEPTLVGLNFYKQLICFVKQYNRRNISVFYAIQTNGMNIDDAWAQFFAENHFLVGISLDGTKEMHDRYRCKPNGEGSYKTVLHAIQLLKKHSVQFNVLTVITAQTAQNIGKIYGFYKRNNLHYQQYIPCLDPLGEERGQYDYSLTPPLYAIFLKKLFDLWYYDITHGEFISIRYFDNLINMLRGCPPENCSMRGCCTCQNVIEADGSVYPCDFYVLDEYKIGNLITDDFKSIQQNHIAKEFIESSLPVNEKCRQCKWQPLCRGGCRRECNSIVKEERSLNNFCESYCEFFEYAIDRLQKIAQQLVYSY